MLLVIEARGIAALAFLIRFGFEISVGPAGMALAGPAVRSSATGAFSIRPDKRRSSPPSLAVARPTQIVVALVSDPTLRQDPKGTPEAPAASPGKASQLIATSRSESPQTLNAAFLKIGLLVISSRIHRFLGPK